MPRDFIVTEWIGSDRVRRFSVNVPTGSEEGFYRSTMSIDCFRNRELLRCFGPARDHLAIKGRWFRVQTSEEYDFDMEVMKSSRVADMLAPAIKMLEDLPTETAESVWDFYKLIGYDYKKQKFTTPSATAPDCHPPLTEKLP